MKKAKKLSSLTIALENLRHRFSRTIALCTISTVLAFSIFSGSTIVFNIKKGVETVRARLGADLIVVPEGYEASYQAVLFSGEPNFFYMDKKVLEEISSADGVEKATPQLFLTSLEAACCAVKIQIIGFDPQSDFIVKPWLSESLSRQLKKGELVVGNAVTVENGSLMLFGKEFPVAAKLTASDSGLDSSVFTSLETMQELSLLAAEKTFQNPHILALDDKVSSVLVKISEETDLLNVRMQILSNVDGVQVLSGENVISNVSKTLKLFSAFFIVFAIMILITSFITLSVTFWWDVQQRKKEWGVLMAIGTPSQKIVKILFCESMIVTTAGAITGILISSLVIFPFNTYIMGRIELPFLNPSFLVSLRTALITLAISTVSGALATVFPAVKICSKEAYIAFREGE